MANAKVSNEDFVIAYATAETLNQVAATVNMKKASVQARRKFLEAKGVKFPKLKSSNYLTDLDIAQLNRLITKHDIRRKK